MATADKINHDDFIQRGLGRILIALFSNNFNVEKMKDCKDIGRNLWNVLICKNLGIIKAF